ncbi:MAG: flagellar hook-basal body complex protein [Vampirovibrio sp.]|nr:flagellar hook-basal body complex protein [Vampirovibrio sp.]
MSQGLFTAASGIRANQVSIDVISNNIANVNTLAFKGSKTNFATAFTQTLKGASTPSIAFGGVNPIQRGTGTQLSEIAVNNSQGGTQFTGRSTDLLINGEGYFVVQNPGSTGAASDSNSFTRAGNFNTDSAGNLVTATGSRVVGTSTVNGATSLTTDTIKVPLKLTIAKFLDSNNLITGTVLGSDAAVAGDFSAYATANGLTPTSTRIATVDLTNVSIATNGTLTATYSNGDRLTVRNNPDATTNSTEILHVPVEGNNFAAINTTAIGTAGRVGQLSGALAGLTSNQTSVNPMLGASFQLQMATFTNKNGLEASANNTLAESANSGEVSYGTPGSGSRGSLLAGSLESSNVDLANEFTNLVVAQRGLEANSKIIKAQSEAMQTILNAVQ